MDATNDNVDFQFAIAKRCVGGPSFNGEDGDECICYGCEKRVHWVKPFVRRTCGINHKVQGHFRHSKRSGGCSGGEGLIHKAAKDAIITAKGWTFYAKCTGTRDNGILGNVGCDCEISVDVPQQEKRAELPFQQYFLDIGILDSSACVVGAVEILHTSQIKAEKRDALTSAGVAWVEVCSEQVLEVYKSNGSGGRVLAVDCAATQCDHCVLRQEEINRQKFEKQILEEANRARQARAVIENENAEAAHHARFIIETHGSRVVAENLAHASRSECAGKDEKMVPTASFWSEVITTTANVLGIDIGKIDAEKEAVMASSIVEKQTLFELSKACGSNVLSFGIHKGNTVEMLFSREETQTYVRWLAGYTGRKDSNSNKPEVFTSSAFNFVTAAVSDEAKQLLNGKCLLCFTRTGQSWKNWCHGCFRQAGGKLI